MASPYRSQNDYDAYKNGELRNLGSSYNSRKRQIVFRNIIDKEVSVSDKILKDYVNDIMAEEYRKWALEILLKAKNNPKAVNAYYDFINAYQQSSEENSFGNVACMAVDRAETLLKKPYNPSKKKQVTS